MLYNFHVLRSGRRVKRGGVQAAKTPISKRSKVERASPSQFSPAAAAEDDSGGLTPMNRKGVACTSDGRPSIRRNEVNKRFSPSYRNPENKELLMGRPVPLGKAMALLATVQYGFRPPVDEHGHADRVNLLKSAAHYALIAEELAEILDTAEEVLRIYLKGLLNAGLFKIKNDLPVAARLYFQAEVFCPVRKSKEIQEHLGLGPGESILDQ